MTASSWRGSMPCPASCGPCGAGSSEYLELEHLAREARSTLQHYIRTRLGLRERSTARPDVEERERQEDEAGDRPAGMGRGAGHATSAFVQRASRRKTGLRASPARPAQGADTNSAVSRRARPQKVGSW